MRDANDVASGQIWELNEKLKAAIAGNTSLDHLKLKESFDLTRAAIDGASNAMSGVGSAAGALVRDNLAQRQHERTLDAMAEARELGLDPDQYRAFTESQHSYAPVSDDELDAYADELEADPSVFDNQSPPRTQQRAPPRRQHAAATWPG